MSLLLGSGAKVVIAPVSVTVDVTITAGGSDTGGNDMDVGAVGGFTDADVGGRGGCGGGGCGGDGGCTAL